MKPRKWKNLRAPGTGVPQMCLSPENRSVAATHGVAAQPTGSPCNPHGAAVQPTGSPNIACGLFLRMRIPFKHIRRLAQGPRFGVRAATTPTVVKLFRKVCKATVSSANTCPNAFCLVAMVRISLMNDERSGSFLNSCAADSNSSMHFFASPSNLSNSQAVSRLALLSFACPSPASHSTPDRALSWPGGRTASSSALSPQSDISSTSQSSMLPVALFFFLLPPLRMPSKTSPKSGAEMPSSASAEVPTS